ncbi:MAG: hypothetical protein A2Z34_01175 [Planctomycetes bacterium RBG_16_59_8]|nr:MAG: hypothetical protein A2Z34_01175 [Planctomycetes bacterium RBG_16_59_8]
MKIADRNDATGHAVWDAYRGGWAFEVVEREDGYFLGGSVTQYLDEHARWPSHEKQSMRFVRGRVLDIGCCAGRHALYLQRKGFDVTPTDISPLLLRIARLRGVKKTRLLSIDRIGAFRAASFETILLLGNNFGLLENRRKARRILRAMHAITTPDGRIIAESADPYRMKERMSRQYRRLNERRGRLPGQRRIRIRYREFTTKWFDYLGVSRSEMESLLEGTGWHLKRTFASGGSPFIAIIEK